jgi:hypothetical protein
MAKKDKPDWSKIGPLKRPEGVTVTNSENTNIKAVIMTVYELIEFADYLAQWNLPGDTVVQFSGYYELNINNTRVRTQPTDSKQAFDELYDDDDWVTEDGIVEYDWPEKDRRKRDREWRGPHYGM